MKCPFELPIEKKVRKYEKGELDALVLVQANGELIHTAGRDKNGLSDKLDYILQAINSHDRLVKELREARQLIHDQALEEAEKEQ